MRLAPGDQLERFEIVAPVGAGGMGEVYRARDPELEREVAIKVLPADLAGDSERVRRFEQEARAIGRLNHPNLLAIHDIGRHEGVPYLVCELLEGETLAERLDSGPVSYRQAIDYAAQIADGLAAAHEVGVVHRDLKPSNLFITGDGRVKILDFGLAKLTEPIEGDPDASPTLTAFTEHGAILGTVGYMSPEQAAGRAVDQRADQFALGVVLYEMLSGRRPFTGETSPEVLTAILRAEPESLARITPETPVPLRWLVERCLAKEPVDRYQSTRDLAHDLRMVGERLSELSGELGVAPPPPRRRIRTFPAVVLGLVSAAGLFAAFLLGLRSAETPTLSYERVTFHRGTVTAARFDPDGESILYSAAWEGEAERLYLKRPGSLDPLAVGPADTRMLSVSPGGEVLLLTDRYNLGPFLRVGTLARMTVAGAPRVLEEHVSGAVWGPEGRLLVVVREEENEAVLEYPPGEVRYSTRGMLWHLRAAVDGERIAFTDVPHRGANAGTIVVMERDGSTRQLARSGIEQGLAWSPSGDELWFPRGNRLMAVDMDGTIRTLASFPQRPVLHDVALDGRVLLSIESRRWELVGKAPGSDSEKGLTWLGWSLPFDISSDGRTILFNECATGVCTVCLRGFDNEPPVVLGSGFGTSLSADGVWALSAPTWGKAEITLIGTGVDERRTLGVQGIERIHFAIWSPDGESIFISGNAPDEGNRIFRIELDGGDPVPVTPEGAQFGYFALSPDGARLAVPLVKGGIDIYDLISGETVTHLPIDEGAIRWSADGRSIYTAPMSNVPGAIHRVDIATGATEVVASLMPDDPAGVVQIGPVAVTPDGNAFVYGYERALSELFVVRGLE